MSSRCGCSTCSSSELPLPSDNRPGSDAIRVRSGTHETFFAALEQRISSAEHRAGLLGLGARDSADPAIALLDAWATVADVLTFYDERIANEGYLRTARDSRSLGELGKLIGYRPRPGVSASAYLAYTVDDSAPSVVIPAGTRAQSTPLGPGEQAQTFETSAELIAKKDWNSLQVRLTRPQRISIVKDRQQPRIENYPYDTLYLAGTTTNLKRDDKLLFTSSIDKTAAWATIRAVSPEPALNRTKITLERPGGSDDAPPPDVRTSGMLSTFTGLLKAAAKPASTQPKSASRLGLRAGDALALPIEDSADAPANDAPLRLLSALHPEAAAAAFSALQRATVTRASDVRVYVLKRTTLFGANAPKVRAPQLPTEGAGNRTLPAEIEWDPPYVFSAPPSVSSGDEDEVSIALRIAIEDGVKQLEPTQLEVDGVVDGVLKNSWLVLDTEKTALTAQATTLLRVDDVTIKTRAAYGLAGKVTQITLSDGSEAYQWVAPQGSNDLGEPFNAIRRTVVWFPGAALELAEVSDDTPVPTAESQQDESEAPRPPNLLPLGGVYSGFSAGRWVIVSGERADIEVDDSDTSGQPVSAPGVVQSELAMVLAVRHQFDPNLPGDRVRSTLVLAQPLAYKFKRDTVKIFGNVVDATLGEKRDEVLGAGDATIANQSFTLRQPPLTYVSAPTVSGVQSTLDVSVNGLRYREVDALLEAGPRDRAYVIQQDEAGKTTLTFGDGVHGARLPTGLENVRARYRNGIGSAGNVAAGRITTPLDKPQGVREVVNPLRASGGADRDCPEDIRRNAPAAIRALDRLVSVQDYEDFAINFAGIGKASAVKLSDGLRDVVHVTIAGIDDAPLLESSDEFRNLQLALKRFGDPQLPLVLGVRSASFLIIDARVTIDADYVWESLEPKLVAAVRASFSFGALALGQPVHASQVTAALQNVAGVVCAELTTFGTITDALETSTGIDTPDVQLAHAIKTNGKQRLRPPWTIAPASIAYVSPSVPETVTFQPVQEKKS